MGVVRVGGEMFSRAEREFLRLLGEGSAADGLRAIEHRFPNPAYRRRLLWGIRRKAHAATGDWALYAKAVRNEPRVIRPEGPHATGIPVHAEPIAALVEGMARYIRVRRGRGGSGERSI